MCSSPEPEPTLITLPLCDDGSTCGGDDDGASDQEVYPADTDASDGGFAEVVAPRPGRSVRALPLPVHAMPPRPSTPGSVSEECADAILGRHGAPTPPPQLPLPPVPPPRPAPPLPAPPPPALLRARAATGAATPATDMARQLAGAQGVDGAACAADYEATAGLPGLPHTGILGFEGVSGEGVEEGVSVQGLEQSAAVALASQGVGVWGHPSPGEGEWEDEGEVPDLEDVVAVGESEGEGEGEEARDPLMASTCLRVSESDGDGEGEGGGGVRGVRGPRAAQRHLQALSARVGGPESSAAGASAAAAAQPAELPPARASWTAWFARPRRASGPGSMAATPPAATTESVPLTAQAGGAAAHEHSGDAGQDPTQAVQPSAPDSGPAAEGGVDGVLAQVAPLVVGAPACEVAGAPPAPAAAVAGAAAMDPQAAGLHALRLPSEGGTSAGGGGWEEVDGDAAEGLGDSGDSGEASQDHPNPSYLAALLVALEEERDALAGRLLATGGLTLVFSLHFFSSTCCALVALRISWSRRLLATGEPILLLCFMYLLWFLRFVWARALPTGGCLLGG